MTLDGVMSFTFSKEGSHTVTVQAAVGNTVHQDQMTVAVYGEPYIIIIIILYYSHFCLLKIHKIFILKSQILEKSWGFFLMLMKENKK